jgi:60S ribosome subunit biogenesis protein NIP7
MSAGKESIGEFKPCPLRVVNIINSIIRCHASSQPQNISYYCKSRQNNGETLVDVYALQNSLQDYIDSPDQQVDIAFVGVHIARITMKRGRVVRIAPMLGLAQLLRVYARVEAGYVKVSDKAEKLFLYGRDVMPESILELREPRGRECNVVLVLNRHGEPLGWGRIVRKANSIYIQNLIDAGWYLRSGV